MNRQDLLRKIGQYFEAKFSNEELEKFLKNHKVNLVDYTQTLPTDIKLLILSKLRRPKDVLGLAYTCKNWRRVTFSTKHVPFWNRKLGTLIKDMDASIPYRLHPLLYISAKSLVKCQYNSFDALFSVFKKQYEGTRFEKTFNRTRKWEPFLKNVCNVCHIKNEPSKQRRRPTSFNMLYKITPELARFCGIEGDHPTISRADATRSISNYIREHQLQNPNNRKQVFPDRELEGILQGWDRNTPLTYFNIQKYIKHNFLERVDRADQ